MRRFIELGVVLGAIYLVNTFDVTGKEEAA